jgi:hypothetical protein
MIQDVAFTKLKLLWSNGKGKTVWGDKNWLYFTKKQSLDVLLKQYKGPSWMAGQKFDPSAHGELLRRTPQSEERLR